MGQQWSASTFWGAFRFGFSPVQHVESQGSPPGVWQGKGLLESPGSPQHQKWLRHAYNTFFLWEGM